MFKVGDLAVYPTQGVGVIESIESKEFVGEKHDFYILRILDSDMTIMIPVNNTGSVGMRTLIDKECVASIYEVFNDKAEVGQAIASWSRRQRGYNEKIKSGDLFEVAEVLRDLYQIKENKELSYGEKKVLELARKLLVKEVALAAGTEEKQVVERVESFFH
ncbi:MAG: CarD family transcriptional regulator [Desulfuromonadales bacterium C00003094]|jgi:CarD family transcriptional regulator|nr:MAG: CarD family transcriptional regulator [Desulfuromonadales bacterium C00003094]OEU75283.1 MAG: CarD family transcriptional regulator [Desulfuromonadales bacterium C00003107]